MRSKFRRVVVVTSPIQNSRSRPILALFHPHRGEPGRSPLKPDMPRSLSDLGLGTDFCPFYLLRRWQNTHLAHAKLRFCRLASGKNHQKSSDKPQTRQTPRAPGFRRFHGFWIIVTSRPGGESWGVLGDRALGVLWRRIAIIGYDCSICPRKCLQKCPRKCP